MIKDEIREAYLGRLNIKRKDLVNAYSISSCPKTKDVIMDDIKKIDKEIKRVKEAANV